MKKAIVSLTAIVALSTAVFAAEDGAGLFKKCSACHGADGEKVALGKSKIIKELSKDQIVTALKGYKTGTYGGAQKAIMKGQVASLSDAQIDAIAVFLKK